MAATTLHHCERKGTSRLQQHADLEEEKKKGSHFSPHLVAAVGLRLTTHLQEEELSTTEEERSTERSTTQVTISLEDCLSFWKNYFFELCVLFVNFSFVQACSYSEVCSAALRVGMADTRSKQSKKGVEQRVEEELVPLVIEDSTPVGMETLVRYLMENNKASERARQKEAEAEASDRLRKKEAEEADRRQDERDRIRRKEMEEAEARAEERQEKREAKKLLLEKEAREELRKQQIEDEKRVFEHQQEMMRLQANLGEKADTARREEADKCRKRDKAVAGIQTYREAEDVEEYLISAEKKLMVSGIPEEEWGAVIAAKLSGRVGAAWGDLQVEGADYGSMKTGLLSICGYTPKIAGDLFFGFRQEALRGMTADHLYRRGVQLLRRMVAPDKLEAGAEFSIVKAWIWAVVPRRTRLLLDSRVVTSQSELILALQDHLVIEGEKGEGQVAVFRKQHYGSEHTASGSSGSSERRPVGNCYKCGKPGHKMADCWQRSGSSESAKPSAGGPTKPIICYTCGVEGHRSPQCPKKGQEKTKPKEGQGQAKPVRKLWHRTKEDTVVEGVVNGQEVPIVLDSGATISVVPEEMVGEELLTGEVVSVMAFQSKEPVSLPTARVQFKVEHLEWEEEVALAPTVEGQGAEVLCRFDVRSDRGFALVSLVREREKVLRAEAQKQAEEDQDNVAIVAKEKPKGRKPVPAEDPVIPAGNESVGTDDGVMAADRPVRTPESGPPAEEEEPNSDFELEEELEEEDSLVAEEEAGDLALLAEEEDEEEEEVLFCLKPKGRVDNDLVISPVTRGSSKRAELVAEVKVDSTLKKWRRLAVVAEDGGEDDVLGPKLSENCEGFDGSVVEDLKRDFPDKLKDGVRREVLKLIEELSASGLTVKLSKCRFGMRKIEYLGHIIGGGELAAPEHRAAAMAEHRLPWTKKQLRSFLGAAGYYRKFGQGFARMSSVLSPWTAKLAPSVVEWTEEGLLAFRDIKVSLVHLCILTIPSEEDVFLLHYDASGAGRTFTVITDHKALVSFLKSKVLNRRLDAAAAPVRFFYRVSTRSRAFGCRCFIKASMAVIRRRPMEACCYSPERGEGARGG